MSDRFLCACGEWFGSEARLTTHLEANPKHWRPGRIPDDVRERITQRLEADDDT